MSSASTGRAPLPDIWWRQSVLTRRVIAAGIIIAVAASVGLLAAWSGDETPPTVAEAYVADLPLMTVIRWEMLAECESGRQWDISTGNGFFGGLQFTQESWNGVGGTGSPADASRDEQIMRAGFLFDLQGWAAWPSCSQQLGFTRPPVRSSGN